MEAMKGSPDYEKAAARKKMDMDMYDLMPPFPSASVPLGSGKEGLQGTGKTTGKDVAPKQTPKMKGYKKGYGKKHPAQSGPVKSVEELRSRAKARKSDSY